MSGTIDWRKIPIEEVGPGVTRQTFHGVRSTVIRYVYAPGSVFAVHSHTEEQTTIILTGRIAFSIDEAEYILGPGDCLMAMSNVPHGAHVIGNETVESINVIAPRRTISPESH